MHKLKIGDIKPPTKKKLGYGDMPTLKIQFDRIQRRLIDIIKSWRLMETHESYFHEETMEEVRTIENSMDEILEDHEKQLGKVALVCIQQIIKLKFFKAKAVWNSSSFCPAFLMDGNADNYHEYNKIGKDNPVLRDDLASDKDWLLNTAKRLLRYGS
tara:strand:- start:63 stop:533 length:471 start_codon:yes stop_codon:yes gene_type:complete